MITTVKGYCNELGSIEDPNGELRQMITMVTAVRSELLVWKSEQIDKGEVTEELQSALEGAINLVDRLYALLPEDMR
jgi:hypothetical protein